MTPQILELLIILGVALVFFSFEWVSADMVALAVLLALILSGLVPPERAFAGFGSATVITILGLLILTAGLVQTGVVDAAGRLLLARTGKNSRRVLLTIMAAAALLSAFISNTAATAFFLPVVIGGAALTRTSAGRLLLPLAFASILASSVTLISSSTNLLASGLMTQYGLHPIAMFELTPVGIPIALVGLVYMAAVGWRLIPERTRTADLTAEFDLRPYLTELVVLPDSPLVGKTLAEAGLGRDLDMTVIWLSRENGRRFSPRATTRLQTGDVLLVEAERDEILKIKDRAGIEIKADVELSDPDLQAEEVRLAEAILLPGSPLIGRTLRGVRFRERYGLQVLGINRRGGTIRRKISQVRLWMGDLLLLQGPEPSLAALLDDNTIRILGAVENQRPDVRRAPLAALIFAGALAAATFNVLPLPVAVLLGAVLIFLTRCLTPEEAYRRVEWKVLILVGSMLTVGIAMEETGTARFLATWIADRMGPADPFWLLTAFFALTVVLTQPMSNQAAAAITLPVAIQTALQLGVNPRTFAMMIVMAASTSFLTPLEPACLMVYGPGRYRFLDFPRVGGLLTVLVYAVAILLVPLMWPLEIP